MSSISQFPYPLPMLDCQSSLPSLKTFLVCLSIHLFSHPFTYVLSTHLFTHQASRTFVFQFNPALHSSIYVSLLSIYPFVYLLIH